MQKLLLTFTLLLLTTACSIPSLDDVLSDERTAYEKSQSLPPLDVPPDLATAEQSDAMTIPGEGKSATFKDYQNQARGTRTAPAQETTSPGIDVITPTAPTPAVAATAPQDANGDYFVAVRGDKAEIWGRLRSFLIGKGYQLDLDDVELGYLETQWSAPQIENSLTYRYKFKLYSEPGAEAGVTLLYLDNASQEQVIQSNGNTIWVDRGRLSTAERLLAGEMNAYFNGQQQQAVLSQPVDSRIASSTGQVLTAPVKKSIAEIQDVGEGKLLLAIPEEYTLAWRHTEQALQSAGLVINSKDQDQGLYRVTYMSAGKEQDGWTSKLKKLKFWGRDKQQGVAYQVALTGVGDKTELVLLNADGEWADNKAAEAILILIQRQYNIL